MSRTKNALTNQIYKRQRLVGELSARVDRRNGELTDVHRSNFNDLGRVLRSLYIFESRLRKEQQQIRRQLGERDAVIRQQQVEIAKLRQTLTSACVCRKNGKPNDDDVTTREDAATDVSMPSKPDLITSISPQSSTSSSNCIHDEPPPSMTDGDGGGLIKPEEEDHTVLHTPKSDPGIRKNVLLVVDTHTQITPPKNNVLNFNKNVYSKTVTDLSLNDISSFPNPTPNNNLFVVSNSIFSKNEFTYNKAPKEVKAYFVFCTIILIIVLKSVVTVFLLYYVGGCSWIQEIIQRWDWHDKNKHESKIKNLSLFFTNYKSMPVLYYFITRLMQFKCLFKQ